MSYRKMKTLFGCFGALMLLPGLAMAVVPETVHYQGHITDIAGEPLHCPNPGEVDGCPSGPVNITFRLYEAPEAGDSFWEETHDTIPVSKGIFHVALGATAPITAELLGKPMVFLSLNVNETGEMMPRQRFISAAFAVRAAHAHRAEDSDMLGGLLPADYVTQDSIYSMCLPADGLAAGITAENLADWNEAHSWGNHQNQGYISTETDPAFASSPASSITVADKQHWQQAYGWGNHASQGYLYLEEDPKFTGSPASGITEAKKLQWDQAYGWGDHAGAAYLQVELDPEFAMSPASSITVGNTQQWSQAYTWGDHNAAGYIKAETDPAFVASPAGSISEAQKADWTQAHSWGDHNTAGYIKAEADTLFVTSPAAGITDAQKADWTEAHSWGDHDSAGYLKAEGDPRVGALMEGHWCRASVDKVECDIPAPVDSDMLASLVCAEGQILLWSGGVWGCANQTDLNTQLTEEAVDLMVANNGYLTAEADPTIGALDEGKWCRVEGAKVVCDQEVPAGSDTLGALECEEDDLPMWDGSEWICAQKADFDTTRSDAEILNVVSAAGYVPGPHPVDTTLSEGDVVNAVLNAGFVKAEEVEGIVNDAGFSKGADTATIDGAAAGLEADNVQDALKELKTLLDNVQSGSSGQVNEGAGTVALSQTNRVDLKPFGTAKSRIHLFNPSPPKVLAYLHGDRAASSTADSDVLVSYDLAPNKYSSGVNGQAGESVIQVEDASVFTVGNHILLYQTVGDSSGSGAGTWELNAVQSVDGSTLTLVSPLENSYEDEGPSGKQSQAVVAASYNNLQVVSGGTIRASAQLASDSSAGGIVYIRAQAITIKDGGRIHADGQGFGPWSDFNRGNSECSSVGLGGNSVFENQCSAGGTNRGNSGYCKGAGGGNKTAGEDQNGDYACGNYGRGGDAKGDASANILTLGGAGGGGESYTYGLDGHGGGLVVIGATSLKVEAGGSITAHGNDGDSWDHGGGAGGTVALFVDEIENEGTIAAQGGSAKTGGWSNFPGAGGEGWIHQLPSVPGIINESYPRGVQIWVDGVNVTAEVGDANGKGAPHWDAQNALWGKTGQGAWESGPLDLTQAGNWTLGGHTIEFVETGGAGGLLESYIYVIYPFTESSVPVNDTCATPVSVEFGAEPTVLAGTTEDAMGKIKASDQNSGTCGGAGGADAVYRLDLAERSLVNAAAIAAFPVRLYLRSGDCGSGEEVYCSLNEFTSNPLEPGTYYLFVDSDSPADKGDYSLAVSLTPAPMPAHDTCDNALELAFNSEGVATDTGTTLYALNQHGSFCGGDNGGDVVYSFNAGPGEIIDITASSPDFDPVIYLFKDTCGGTPVFCDYSNGQLTTPAQSGGDYWLVVDGVGEKDWGAFTIEVELSTP